MMNVRLKSVFLVLLFSFKALAQAPVLVAPPEAQREMIEAYERILRDEPERLSFLNPEQRKRLLYLVRNNEVASLSKIPIYDPPQNGSEKGEIGYCYGRAMATHLIARKMGLAESSIQKIFAAGDMQNGSIRWRFHVATVVMGEDQNLYVIDPIVAGLGHPHPEVPLPLLEWIDLIKSHYDNTAMILEKHPELAQDSRFSGGTHFYLASPEAIMVDMREIPAEIDLENGERIIEVLFDPLHKAGFRPVYRSNLEEPIYYEVQSQRALADYFMILDEPERDQFNFFKLDALILYRSEGQAGVLSRHYIYNGRPLGSTEFQDYHFGYFPSLIKSVQKISERF